MKRREFITLVGGAGSKRPVKLVTAAILCFAGVYAEAAEIHDGDTGYIAKNSIWFTDESDLSVWKRVRQTFAPKDVKTYQQIILEERQAWQFSGPIKVKVISYWANQHEIHVKMLTEGRLADSEWWVEDKGAPRKIGATHPTPQNCRQMIPLRSRSDSLTFTPGPHAIDIESNFSRCPCVNSRSQNDYAMARELLERAIELDPAYAQAHARFAYVMGLEVLYGWKSEE